MTSSSRPAYAPAAPAPLEVGDAIDLLALVAQLEHTAFVRMAADSSLAPTLEQRLELSRLAADAVARRDRVLVRVQELGGDPVAALRQYDDVLDEFDARTQPSTWWERLLKVYVGYGVADDFCRLAAEALDPQSRELVLAVLDDASHAELAVAELDAAGAEDGALSSRLALWGRRIVGEALGVVQGLLSQRPPIARLVQRAQRARAEAAAVPEPASGQGAAEVPTSVEGAKVFGELTAQHTRRMSRLGLTA
jgi:hypothetical protein